MNWISKFIKPGFKTLFKRQPKPGEASLWTTCVCQQLIYKEDLHKNFFVCPKCETHQKMSCRDRFKIFFDNNEYEVLKTPLPPDDPLNFVDTKKYVDRLAAARKLTGQDDAIMIASGKLKEINITVGAQNFSFIGGSVGSASGEAFIHGAQHAIDNQNPFIFFSCSGGQRMMESALALQQMSRTVLAVNELKKNNLPYIVVLTNPTTGGVTGSWAMLGDIIIAEPKATIGFAGKRVIEQTIGETLPEGFQTSEYIKDHGGIDLIVSRRDLRDTIGTLIAILLKKNKTTSIEAVNENQENIGQIASTAS
jgi:acetyl-CoA carboxylase carboxyl transferase subunit beta